MIKTAYKDISDIKEGNKQILGVYKGSQLVWENEIKIETKASMGSEGYEYMIYIEERKGLDSGIKDKIKKIVINDRFVIREHVKIDIGRSFIKLGDQVQTATWPELKRINEGDKIVLYLKR